MKLGDKGDAVRAVQSQWRFIDHDGIFGQGLDALVRQFQKDNKLTVDGVVGPNTWKAMGKGPIIDASDKTPSDRLGRVCKKRSIRWSFAHSRSSELE